MSVCEIVGFLSAFFIVYIHIRVYINTIANLVPYTKRTVADISRPLTNQCAFHFFHCLQ